MEDDFADPNLTSVRGDIRDRSQLEQLFAAHRFGAVFHLAAILAHAVKDKRFLWESNVDGTRNIAELARAYRVPKVVSPLRTACGAPASTVRSPRRTRHDR